MDSIHGFAENIDQYGQKELPFPIKKIPHSDKFSLIISYNYTSNNVLTKELTFLLLRVLCLSLIALIDEIISTEHVWSENQLCDVIDLLAARQKLFGFLNLNFIFDVEEP